MTEDTSPENLRKFLESDNPVMVRRGLSMAKEAGVEVTVKDLERFLNTVFEPLQTLKFYEKLSDTKPIVIGFIIADEAGIGDEVMEMLCEILWHTWPRESVPIHNDDEKRSAADRSLAMEVVKVLGDIGDLRTVEPLIKVLQYHDSTDPGSSSSTSYGRLGPKEVRKGAADALDKLGWKPETDEQRASYIIAKEDWDALVELGEAAAKPLVEAIKWDNGGLVGYGTPGKGGIEETLKRIGDSAVEVLTEALTDEYLKVRKTAARVFESRGVSLRERLLMIEDGGEVITGKELEKLIFEAGMGGSLQEEKLAAKERLIRNGDERMVELIIEKLESPSTLLDGSELYNRAPTGVVIPVIAFAMSEVFVEIGETAVEPVIKALEKTGGSIGGSYGNYASALGKIGDKRAVEPLLKIIEKNPLEDNRSAVEALGKFDDPRAVEPLIEKLKVIRTWGYEPQEAAIVLMNNGSEQAIKALIEVANNDNDDSSISILRMVLSPHGGRNEENEKRVLERILEKMDDVRLIKLLGKCLDSDIDTSEGAARELIKFGKLAVDALGQNIVADEQYWVSITAADALGEIGDASAVKFLIDSLDLECERQWEWYYNTNFSDEMRFASHSISEAIVKIGDKRVIEPLLNTIKSYFLEDAFARKLEHYECASERDTPYFAWIKEDYVFSILIGLGWRPETDEERLAFSAWAKSDDWDAAAVIISDLSSDVLLEWGIDPLINILEQSGKTFVSKPLAELAKELVKTDEEKEKIIKFLESDDPGMVLMGASMLKGILEE